MKTAVRILVIIAGVVGIVWAIIGFFGVAAGGSISTVFQTADEAKQTIEQSTTTMTKLIGSLIFVVAGLIFGTMASGKESKKVTGIVLSVLLILCGIITTSLASYVTGPIYVLCGILALIANAASKRSIA